ncbi:hypothetical protein RclHR1_13670007 [Rhizophagus clarus]|uniref:F-box domain-containing protein n=1 Tax=Rhizophagus clarus TaxID=94130 RepID=A0A2Z6R353_9GLOM|nr:hypothetical protein RclHR1_13670007 [Rhizophagus clarus]GES74617.1 hypothetical protein GLOIN_2v1876445 [Rhizophagus clarus]
MTCKLPSDCLNEILEYLEEDKLTLHSCLLVNRLWCEISVRILWRNIWNFINSNQLRPFRIDLSIFNTLFACLPNESKELLYKNEIFIPTSISKPMFNYAAFCKVLSIYGVDKLVDNIFRDKPTINSLSLEDRNYLATNEIIKMFANQIYSLKKLSCYYHHCNINFSFPYFPGARNLLELHCSSNLPSDFFYQLSQLCHNLQILSIDFHNYDASNELKELVSLQNSLKTLKLSAYDSSWKNIIPALKNHTNTITKLHLYGDSGNLPFSFVSSFTNLQEFIFSFIDGINFEDFKILQYVNFSKLQTLKIPYQCPKPEYIMKFLENNGKNILKFHTDENDKALSLSVAKFCPNLKSLFIIFNNGELDILKTIFNNCQNLESIKVWCGKSHFSEYLSEKGLFETIINHSSKNFCELKIYNSSNSDVTLEDLESFFISWMNRTPKKLLSFIIIKDDYYYDKCKSLDDRKEIMKIIEKYEKLGVIKFGTIGYEEEDKEEEEVYYYQ